MPRSDYRSDAIVEDEFVRFVCTTLPQAMPASAGVITSNVFCERDRLAPTRADPRDIDVAVEPQPHDQLGGVMLTQ
jgi:hypothetical protein